MSIRYMIHACPQRMWYVNEFLLPSMYEQGIREEEVLVWNDEHGWGNLKSFVESMRYVSECFPSDEGIWHLQDDVLISADFKEQADKANCLSYGFCNKDFDKEDPGSYKTTGHVTVYNCWHSFQCVFIPNRYCGEFFEWFDYLATQTFRLMPYTKTGKMDDTVFRLWVREKHRNEPCWNVYPNIVEHIDYLIGGTSIHSRRPPRISAHWTDFQRIRDLNRAIDKKFHPKTNKDKKYVVYSLTRNYYPYLEVSLRSLIKHNPKLTKIFLLIEDDHVPFSVPKNVECINISGQTLFPEDYINAKDYHTYACAIRVAHTEFLPSYVDRVLALDCDCIICDDLSPLWDIDLSGKWFAGGLELEHWYRPYGEDFYNGGVILHNLDQQRLDNAAETMVRYLIHNKVPNLDEEALNKYAVPAKKAVPFPTRYNENMFNGYTNDPAIVHFVGVAEWWKEGKFRSEYWKEYMNEK